MQDELESLSASVQVMQVNIGHSVQVMQNNIADSVQVMQVNISQLSRAIEDKLCQLRPGNIQTDSMQMVRSIAVYFSIFGNICRDLLGDLHPW